MTPEPSFVARNIDPAAANAIHDDDVARRFGFEGALVPGVELWGCAVSALGAGPGQRVALRFRRPVYDGERVDVVLGADSGLVLRGPGGGDRAVGRCEDAAVGPVHPDDWPVRRPGPLLPAEPASLPPGPLPTVEEEVDADRAAAYVARTGDAAWTDAALLHPGLLLRAVNLVLMRAVALGPWIHTASDAVLLAPAPVGPPLQVRAVCRGTSVRSGHDEVRYDALVLSGGAPVLQVAHTALFRLSGAATPRAAPGPPARP